MFDREFAKKCYEKRPLIYYHTSQHIKFMINVLGSRINAILDEFPDMSIDLLLDMIYYHDCVYDISCETIGKNEQDSADLFLSHNGIGKEQSLVANAILSTIPTRHDFKNPYEQVLHDLDWFSFSDLRYMREHGFSLRREARDGYHCDIVEAFKKQKKFYTYLLNELKYTPGYHVFVTRSFYVFNTNVEDNLYKYLEGIDILLTKKIDEMSEFDFEKIKVVV